MADIVSNLDKMNDLEVSSDAPVTESLMTKKGANINGLIDDVAALEFSTVTATQTGPTSSTWVDLYTVPASKILVAQVTIDDLLSGASMTTGDFVATYNSSGVYTGTVATGSATFSMVAGTVVVAAGDKIKVMRSGSSTGNVRFKMTGILFPA